VPFVSPEKKAEAMAQKKKLPITSVKGRVTVCPEGGQEPVSACKRAEVTEIRERSAASATARLARSRVRGVIAILSFHQVSGARLNARENGCRNRAILR
jgi:hypothetical protein